MFGRDERDQLLFDAVVVHGHVAAPHFGPTLQMKIDLAELDPEIIDLDLIVLASLEHEHGLLCRVGKILSTRHASGLSRESASC